MILAITILVVTSLIASGILFEHRRMLTYIAVAGTIFEIAWLMLTYISRTILQHIDTNTVFLTGAVILTALAASQYKHWRAPYHHPGSGKQDVAVLCVLLIVLTGAHIVIYHNGFSENEWVMHGFYNGDTATFASLVQKSALTNRLVTQNPFAGNGDLEYPTLLHAGIATLFSPNQANENWLHFLPIMMYAQIIITVPLLFLLLDVHTSKAPPPLQAALVLYVLALSWDSYIYPQSHFFLTGIFILLAALLHQNRLAAAYITAATLLAANAVSGTAAVALIAIFHLLRTVDTSRKPIERGLFLAALPIIAGIYWLIQVGDGALGAINFSYTAALDMLRLALPVIAIAAASFYTLQQRFATAAFTTLCALALITFFFSTRDIVVENASRFFYHAILISFPAVSPFITRIYYIIRRELLFTTHTLAEQLTGWGIVIGVTALVLFPTAASVASAYDNLLFQKEQYIDIATREALWWIQDSTHPDVVFIASPYEPFIIPYFTGRAMLRADYWLSPNDVTLEDTKAAFSGDKAAQEHILSHADYLFVRTEEKFAFEEMPEVHTKAFENAAATIFKLNSAL